MAETARMRRSDANKLRHEASNLHSLRERMKTERGKEAVRVLITELRKTAQEIEGDGGKQ